MEQGNKILKKLEEHDKQFEKIDKQFERNEQVHKNIAEKLSKHDDKFVGLENQIKQSEDRIMGKLDEVLGVVNKLDQERCASVLRMDRMQEEIDGGKIEMKKVKKVLKMA